MRVQITFDVPEVPGLGTRPRRRHRLLAVAALVGLLAVPTGVFANHLFSDVPDTNTFHGNINAIANAGITSGCTPTTYCPDQPVTRGQMAAFLQRGLGRVEVGAYSSTTVGTTNNAAFGSPISIMPGISPGAIDGAAQFIQASAAFTVTLTDDTGCPCVYRIAIREGAGNYLNPRYVDVTLTTEGASVPISVVGADLVSGSGAKSVQVVLFRSSGSGTASAYGQLVANTVPFPGDGSIALAEGPSGDPDDPETAD